MCTKTCGSKTFCKGEDANICMNMRLPSKGLPSTCIPFGWF